MKSTGVIKLAGTSSRNWDWGFSSQVMTPEATEQPSVASNKSDTPKSGP